VAGAGHPHVGEPPLLLELAGAQRLLVGEHSLAEPDDPQVVPLGALAACRVASVTRTSPSPSSGSAESVAWPMNSASVGLAARRS
jgi:hypothetical protein